MTLPGVGTRCLWPNFGKPDFRKLRKLRGSDKSECQKAREPDTIILPMIRDVTDLDVYLLSLKLLRNLYSFLKKVPKSEYDSVRQSKRAGKSISALVAEGFAKRSSELEFKRFLKMAIGSSDEVISHLRAIVIAVPQLLSEAKEIADEYKVLSKRLNRLHRVWRSGFF